VRRARNGAQHFRDGCLLLDEIVTRSCGLEAVLSAWIAGHNHELFDEIRNYYRHEDFRIVSFWLRFRDAQGMKHNLLR